MRELDHCTAHRQALRLAAAIHRCSDDDEEMPNADFINLLARSRINYHLSDWPACVCASVIAYQVREETREEEEDDDDEEEFVDVCAFAHSLHLGCDLSSALSRNEVSVAC